MKKCTVYVLMLLFLTWAYSPTKAQDRDKETFTYRGHQAYKGTVRIKFKDSKEVNAKLNRLVTGRVSKQGVVEGDLRLSDFPQLSARNQQFGAVKMKRVFRPAGKFEARHRAWGLHLWYEITVDKNVDLQQVLSAYEGVADIQMAEPRYEMSLNTLSGAPNDPQYSTQASHYDLVNAVQAWGVETGHSDVVVAIEDQGVDYNHPDLAGNMWTNSGEVPNNGIDDDNNGYVDDYYGYNFGDNTGDIAIDYHGTHVAGTVAAETNNGTGVSGLAGGSGSNDGVRLMSCTVFGANNQDGFDEAFIYAADNGAVISQNSWGGGSQSTALENAIDYFIANAGGAGEPLDGGLVVFAAGNSNSQTTGAYPGNYSPVLAVASTTHSGVKSSFSNYGSWVDIAAPGSNILSTYPTSQGSYNTISGTSMACPHVSGVAALVASKAYRDGSPLTAAQLRNTLESTANFDLLYNNNGSYSGQLGSGMLDAYAALTGQVPPPPPASYCASQGNSVADEYIGRVQLNTIDNSSTGGSGYSDHTNISTDLSVGQSYTITITPTWTGTVYSEGYAVWIDFDQDTTFSSSELVWSQAATQNTTVSGSFSIPSSALAGATRMRVSMKYNGIPTACEAFSYGEVEDYAVNITTGGGDTQAPTAPTGLSAANTTQTGTDLSWNASSDNVGVTGYDVYQDGSLIASVSGTSYSVSGLTASTTYAFNVRAKDAAGNVSGNSNTLNVTTSDAPGGGGCTGGISSFPYSESFESGLGSWAQASGDDLDWTRDASGTPSSNTGPSSGYDGSYYMYVEASSPNYPSKTAVFNSPCFDLSGESTANFTFAYHMYGSAMGSLDLQASDDNGASWTSVWSISGNQGNAWQTVSVSLASYVGGSVQFRFVGTTGSSWSSDIAIDQVGVSTSGSGGGGNSTVVLTLLTDNYGSETSWALTDGSGSTVASGSGYANNTTYTETFSLAAGCYTFTINDSYGDGICCSYGNGSYSLDEGSTNLGSGGSFGSSESVNFCVSGTASVNSFASQSTHSVNVDNFELNAFPNPVSVELSIRTKGFSNADFTVLDITGRQVATGVIRDGAADLPVSNLKAGVYIIRATENGKTLTTKFIKK